MKKSPVTWALAQRLPATHALVLRTLAWRAGIRGGGWLTQPQLAEESNGIHLSTFKRALKDLQELGLVHVRKKNGINHLICTYEFDLTRHVRWDRKAMTWRNFLRQEIAKQRKLVAEAKWNERREGESIEQHTQRVLARTVAILKAARP